MNVRSKVAVVGYAHSVIERRSGRAIGAVAVETARAAIADAGLTVEQVDLGVTIPARLQGCSSGVPGRGSR